MRAARTTADQEDPLEASEAADFTSLLARELLGHGPAAVEDEEATMIEDNVKEFETCRPALTMSGYRVVDRKRLDRGEIGANDPKLPRCPTSLLRCLTSA